jgi:hypothetical protein
MSGSTTTRFAGNAEQTLLTQPRTRNRPTQMLTVCAIVLVGTTATITQFAFANPYEAMEGVRTGTGWQIGVGGAMSAKNPYISPGGFSNHRDYMPYINDAYAGATIGAGYYTQDGSTLYDLIYHFVSGGSPNHDLYDTIPLNTNFNAQVTEQNNDPNSHCWSAFAYQTPTETFCLTSTIAGASNIGQIARTFTAYSSNNDLYGYFYNLQSEYKTSGGIVGWESFSAAASANYKCWSSASNHSGSYVESYQTTQNIIGTGPRTYTTDSCQAVNAAYDPMGENSKAGV